MKAPRWTVLLAVAVMAAILIAVASAASARSTKSEAEAVQDRSRQLVHRQHVARRDGEPLQGRMQDAALQQAGDVLRLQLG